MKISDVYVGMEVDHYGDKPMVNFLDEKDGMFGLCLRDSGYSYPSRHPVSELVDIGTPENRHIIWNRD